MAQFSSRLYPQTNPTNPILCDIRRYQSQARSSWRRVLTDFEFVVYGESSWGNASPAQVRHARRVLTRLASITG
ncbi:hypothetical protein QFZ21_001847 [Microbacterium sp. W4I20]|nr:hypothetical protein [Microbacterium sp. W4I20]